MALVCFFPEKKIHKEKFARYIDILFFDLECRLVPWPQWVRLSDDCFNFRSDISDEERKLRLEKLMQEKYGPVPLKDDEKARIHAEYVTLMIPAKALRENAKLDTAEEYWYKLSTVQQYYENCPNINEFAFRFLTRTFNKCTVESEVSAIDSIKTSSIRLKHETAEKWAASASRSQCHRGSVRFVLCRKTVAFCCVEYKILHFQGCRQVIS